MLYNNPIAWHRRGAGGRAGRVELEPACGRSPRSIRRITELRRLLGGIAVFAGIDDLIVEAVARVRPAGSPVSSTPCRSSCDSSTLRGTGIDPRAGRSTNGSCPCWMMPCPSSSISSSSAGVRPRQRTTPRAAPAPVGADPRTGAAHDRRGEDDPRPRLSGSGSPTQTRSRAVDSGTLS